MYSPRSWTKTWFKFSNRYPRRHFNSVKLSISNWT